MGWSPALGGFCPHLSPYLMRYLSAVGTDGPYTRSQHRRRNKISNVPGHAHELTFSCFGRRHGGTKDARPSCPLNLSAIQGISDSGYTLSRPIIDMTAYARTRGAAKACSSLGG